MGDNLDAGRENSHPPGSTPSLKQVERQVYQDKPEYQGQ
jgi:hypothetical protein